MKSKTVGFEEGTASLKVNLRTRSIWHFPSPESYFHLLLKLFIFLMNAFFVSLYLSVQHTFGDHPAPGRNVAFMRKANFSKLWRKHKGQLHRRCAVSWIKGFKRNLTLILTLPILRTIPISQSALILHRFCTAGLNKEQMKGKELWSISTALWLSPPEGIKPACLVSYSLICMLCSAYTESTYQRRSIYFMLSKYDYMINLNFKLYSLNRASFHGFLGCVKLYIIPNSCQCVNTQLKYFPDSYKESS